MNITTWTAPATPASGPELLPSLYYCVPQWCDSFSENALIDRSLRAAARREKSEMTQRSNDAHASDAGHTDLNGAVTEVGAAVMAASRLFMAISARALADITPALTLQQLRTLVVLQDQEPIKLAALAAALTVNPSTAMRTVDKLGCVSEVPVSRR